jgi:hypothetical protein
MYGPDRHLSENEWRQIAAHVGDSYRPDIASPSYRALLELKVRYALEGLDETVHRGLDALRSELAQEILKVRGEVREQAIWLFQETREFDEFVMTDDELPVLESLLLETESATQGRDLCSASPRDRSAALRQMLDNDQIEWTGLPNALMRFVTDEFSDQVRLDPFWQRIQREIGPYFQPASLDDPNYRDLLRLQIRFHGFSQPAERLLPSALQLQAEIKQRPHQNEFSRLLAGQSDDLVELIQRNRSAGQGPAGGR